MNGNGNGHRQYRILSLDGGGIRGIITLGLLKRLVEESGIDLFNPENFGFDLIAGTSTGGIIALGLAHGLSVSDLEKLYREHGGDIFHSEWPYALRELINVFSARYDNRFLARALADRLGDTTLGMLKRHVLISAFSLNGDEEKDFPYWKAKFFHNLPGSEDAHQSAREVALYTAAAPVYFPTAHGYVDGGVVANNPCMAALAQTQDRRYFPNPRAIPDEIIMLSIGTGRNSNKISGTEKLKWGYVKWIWPLRLGPPLLSLMMDGDAHVAAWQCEQLLGANFRRLQITFDPDDGVAMDLATKENISRMDRYVRAYSEDQKKTDFKDTVQWIRDNWQAGTPPVAPSPASSSGFLVELPQKAAPRLEVVANA